MSLQAHLAELEKKHRTLSRQIDQALAHRSADDLELVEWKRRKLMLKDEINRLQERQVPGSLH